MIASLRGKISNRFGDELVIDVNGVGYLVLATGAVLAQAERNPAETSILVYTDVRENAIALFGFANQLEREAFLLLRKVKGIGSKTSLAIVSQLGAEALLSAVGQGDVQSLLKVSGVGRKTAERILVELREYVGAIVIDEPLVPQVSRTRDTGVAGDAMLALEKLGFTADRAREAVQLAVSRSPQASNDAGELVRLSLANL